MVVLPVLLCLVAFLSTSVSGKSYRTACSNSYEFRCDSAVCIKKNDWCNRRTDCSDGSDEKYCQTKPKGSSCKDIHFQCDNGMCIPKEGYCDGYSSCSDQSDEKNCPCEELYEREGNIQYEAYIDSYRTQQKCFKFSVNEAQYLQMKISAMFKSRNCIYGNLTVYSTDEFSNLENFTNREYISGFEDNYNDVDIYCPSENGALIFKKSFTFYKDVYVRYRSNYYISASNSLNDLFNVTFRKVDMMCLRPDAFKCSEYSCISPEKQCDGKKDCENGLDEQNCDYGTFSVKYRNSMRIKATRWMRSQHNADWGWNGNTHKAIVALHLVDGANFNGSSKDDDLIAKQLEMEVMTYLLRQKFDDEKSSTELAAYINALLAICHNPRNFYGFNLVAALKKDLETYTSFTPPFSYLTLCNADEHIPEDAVDRLLQILEINETNHGFILELQALATMALSCINNNRNPIQYLQQNITDALNNLKKQQMEDGSFGNKYTTALVLQALIANNQQEISTDWNPKAAIQFLFKNQEADGSFGDFLTTYLIMPVLNAKSLVDVGKINCTDKLKRPRDDNTVSDIRNRSGKKVMIKYSLFVGNKLDQIHPMLLRTPENITVLELMTLAADLDPKYKFKIHEIRKKKFIYEIFNIPNDPENNRFWFIYRGSNDSIKPTTEQSPDKIKAYEKDHIIMWYRTLDSFSY